MLAPEDPAVAAIMATKPTTPVECARAAKILADLGRADLAKTFIKKVLDAHLDQQQLADLSEQLGPSTFFDLSARAALQPEGKQLADAVAAAAKAWLQDRTRIAAWVAQLQDPSPEKRLEAMIGLEKRALLRSGHCCRSWPIRHAGRVRQCAGGVGRNRPASPRTVDSHRRSSRSEVRGSSH